MITIIRKHQQSLMIIVSILVIIAFVWLYNDTNLEKVGTDRVATIYGRTLTLSEVERSRRMMQLNGALQQFDYLQGLIGNVVTDEQAVEAFSLNQIVLKYEADTLGIHPPDAEVAETLRTLAVFQTEGRFDVAKYSQFLEEMLAPNGFTQAQLEEAVRNQLRFRKIRELIGSAAGISDTEARDLFDKSRRKMALSVIRLNTQELAGEFTPSDDLIKARFEEGTFESDETRKVRFVRMELSEEDKKLEGRERVQAMQKLSDRAGEFTQAMLEPGADFDSVAARFELQVQTTGEFARTGTDPAFAAVPALVPAAFSLSESDPNSDAVTFKDGFYVLHLETITAARPLTLEEARERITALLMEEKSREKTTARAEEIRASILESMKNGVSFADAAKAAGTTAEVIPPFSFSAPNFQMPDWREIAMQAAELQPGEVSGFTPAASGGLLVFLEKYEPVPDEEYAAEKAMVTDSLLERRRDMLFREWLRDRRDAAEIRILQQT